MNYTMPSVALKKHNIVVSGTSSTKMSYLDMNEPDPTTRTFELGSSNVPTSMEYSPNLDLLFVGTKSSNILVLSFKAQDFKIVHVLSGHHEDLISSVVYLSSCKLLFSSSYDGNIASWLYDQDSSTF